jgi:UDP-N-acetylmuramate--alanine ligase
MPSESTTPVLTGLSSQVVMESLSKDSRIYFVGIGGISMSGLAELSQHYGYIVGGSDMHPSERTAMLAARGILFFEGHDKSNLVTFNPDLLVHTAAILPGNPELAYAREKGIPTASRAEFLGHLTTRFESVINISGTHGKTTTTSMLSLILMKSGVDPTVHLGAEFTAFGGTVRFGADNSLLVSEACEYQRSFLHFRSTTAAITNIDYDHVDCFKNIFEVIAAFVQFTEKLEDSGYLILPAFDVNAAKAAQLMIDARKASGRSLPKILTTGKKSDFFAITGIRADFYADNITYLDGFPSFDVWAYGEFYAHIDLKVPGEHNIYNALTAIACAVPNGGTREAVASALSDFYGAEGRFTRKGKYHGAMVIADYAHHPAAARATLQAATQIPHKHTWVVFQPLTFNRTEALFDDYVTSLLPCEHVIFAEIFSDREINPGTISSSMIADKINSLGGHAEFYADKNEIPGRLSELVGKDDLILFLGPEDIREMADEMVLRDNAT